MSFLGPYIAALEHHIADHPPESGHFLVKGLSAAKRDKRMTDLLDFDTFIESDYSRFDRRVSIQILQLVEFVCLTFLYDDTEFARVLSLSWKTFGLSSLGTKYHVDGTRCSGDAWTSIGNGLINRFLTWVCLRDMKYKSYHEGDDGVIGIHRRDVSQVMERLQFLDILGFKAKIAVHNTIDTVSFCGRKLYQDASMVRSYCDLERSLAKINTTVSEGDPQALLLAKMMSYNATDRHTPIVGALTWSIICILSPQVNARRLKRAKAHIRSERYEANFEGIGPPNVPNASRASAYMTSGYSPAQQLAFEAYYASWVSLGFIPSVVDKLPGDWQIDDDSYVVLNDHVA